MNAVKHAKLEPILGIVKLKRKTGFNGSNQIETTATTTN